MSGTIRIGKFEWAVEKASYNLAKHGVDFFDAAEAFLDPDRIIAIDEKHSQSEQREIAESCGFAGNLRTT